jgi:hypothetical protein
MTPLPREIPSFLREMLNAPPRAGEGVHNWLFRVARHLHAHLPANEIVTLLESLVQGCGRHVNHEEIKNAVKNSIKYAWQPRSALAPVQHAAKWPYVNQERRAAITRESRGLVGLWDASQMRLEGRGEHVEDIIDRLFPSNPLLCCGKSISIFDTKTREEWRGELFQLALIVPSPMSAVTGLTKDGHESKHTLANTGARRFLICEFDFGTADEHADLLMHLGGYAPLICAVHSGGKSLHGWFYVHGQPDAKIEMFFRYAVSVGADRATWTRSQFVRMPDGTRDNGNHQTVFFVNFKTLEDKQ